MLGPGYLEAVYQRAMAIELRHRGVGCRREVAFELSYKGEDVGDYRADLICDNGVLVELKAHGGLNQFDEAQVIHYLRATGLSTGLLINFGLPTLERRRFVLGQAWRKEIELGDVGEIGGSRVTTPSAPP
jgi:GxxExxY protein